MYVTKIMKNIFKYKVTVLQVYVIKEPRKHLLTRLYCKDMRNMSFILFIQIENKICPHMLKQHVQQLVSVLDLNKPSKAPNLECLYLTT